MKRVMYKKVINENKENRTEFLLIMKMGMII